MKKLSVILCALLVFVPSITVHAHYGTTQSSGESITSYILAVVIAALVIAGVYVSGLVKDMNTIRPASEASNYIVDDSFVLSEQSDRFLYSHTMRVRIPKNNNGPRR